MESLETSVLESIKRQPEKNTDGTIWKLHIPPKSYTKAYIVENWDKDLPMKKAILEKYLDLVTFMAGKEP